MTTSQMSAMQVAVQDAATATKGMSEEVQKAAVSAAASAAILGLPDAKTSSWLWKVLVVGLVTALILSLGGVLVAVLDGSDQTDPDLILTLFTAVLTGLIGLFVRTPTRTQ